jgi:hypothetical protein
VKYAFAIDQTGSTSLSHLQILLFLLSTPIPSWKRVSIPSKNAPRPKCVSVFSKEFSYFFYFSVCFPKNVFHFTNCYWTIKIFHHPKSFFYRLPFSRKSNQRILLKFLDLRYISWHKSFTLEWKRIFFRMKIGDATTTTSLTHKDRRIIWHWWLLPTLNKPRNANSESLLKYKFSICQIGPLMALTLARFVKLMGKKLTLGWIFLLTEHQLTRAMQAMIAENYADLYFNGFIFVKFVFFRVAIANKMNFRLSLC